MNRIVPFLVLLVLAVAGYFFLKTQDPGLLSQFQQTAATGLKNVGASAQSGAAAPSSPSDAAADTAFNWDNSIIQIEVTAKEYNYIQPWERSEHKVFKTGVVIDSHQIITTAQGLADQTLIRLKKQGGGLFSLGRVVWIDYQANLAALSTDDTDFWKGLQPASLADPVPVTGSSRILRWRGDELEKRSGEIERMTVDNSTLSFVSVPVLKIDSAISGAGSSEAVTVGDKLVGLACEQGGDVLYAVPTSFISSILKARADKTYTGLGYFDFTWDQAENPMCLEYLRLPKPARGVIVKETGLKPGLESMVHARDVILQIDGFDIDVEGNYSDPQYNKLSLESLSSRGKWAGMDCKMKIWRDGKEMDLTYKLPKAGYGDALVPSQSFDQDPEYVLAGGFVFTPLTEAYLRSWGANWRQAAPFRLAFYENDKVHPERPQRVVLSQVLPNEANIGYEGLRNAVLDKINGIKIKQISDIPVALKSPQNGFDVFEFEGGDSTREAVLDASDMDQANQEIMARYHIPADHVLNATLAASDPVSSPVVVK